MSPLAKRLLSWSWHGAVLVAVGLAAWHFIDFRELGQTLSGVSAPWLALLLALATLDRVLMADKWRHLLRAGGVNAPFSQLLSAYYQSALITRFLPSSLGGDALRAVLVTGRHGRASVVLASMVVEKLMGMLAAIVIAVFGALLVVWQARELELVLVLAAVPVMLLLVVGLLALSLQERFVTRALDLLPGRQLRAGLRKVYGDYLAYRESPKVLIGNFFYSVLEQSLQVTTLLACAVALSVDASMTTLIAAIGISQCVRKFAILVESWVLGEFTNVMVCSLLGIAKAQALAFSLLNHAVGVVAALPGAVLLARSTARLRDARRLHARRGEPAELCLGEVRRAVP